MEERIFNIAIVEDDHAMAKELAGYLDAYSKERGCTFSIKQFSNAENFLAAYRITFDIVFMDIDMPGMNGMQAAHKLRELDSSVVIVFVTNLAQYALEGYSVDAIDYLLKPIDYKVFAFRMDRVVKAVSSVITGRRIVVSTDQGTVVIHPQELIYVEVVRHKLVYHTLRGTYEIFGTLKELEYRLSGQEFVRCNACYLINLRYVKSAKRYEVKVGEEILAISHAKYKDFMDALNNYLGDGY